MEWREGGENCIMRSFMICTLRQVLIPMIFKEYEMGGARSTNGEKRNTFRLLLGKIKEKRSL
jgi:hypothetical protein